MERKGVGRGKGEGVTSGPIRIQFQAVFDMQKVDVKLDHGFTVFVIHMNIMQQLTRRLV